ncbi:MAG: hypothetical protein PHF63_12555 [Herbinix sp.]|nr:hypothetical protein [Herbinix sp.]
MEDNNNNTQQPQAPIAGAPADVPQGQSKNTNESTYWETPQTSEQSQQYTGQKQQTPEQYQQFSGQQQQTPEQYQQYSGQQPYSGEHQQTPEQFQQYSGQYQQPQGQYQQYSGQQPYSGEHQQTPEQFQQYSSQQQQPTEQFQQYSGQYQQATGQYQPYPGQQPYSGQYQQNPGQDSLTGSGTPTLGATDQFNSYYQQQINSNAAPSQYNGQPGYSQQYTQSGFPAGTQKQKKKSHGKVIAAVIVLLILFSGTATAYAFRGTIINTYAQLTKSPVEYYAYIEKKTITDSIDNLKPYLNLTSQDTAINVKSDVSIDRETVDSLMQSSLDMSLEDFESQLGVPIESFGFDVLYGHKDNIINETLGVRFNQVNLITMELFMDTTANDYFVRLPELSKAYLDFTDELSDTDIDLSQIKLPSTDQTIDLLNRYSNIIVDNITEVEVEKDKELNLDTLSTTCTKLTVTITNDDAYNICKAILTEAKEDEYLINLLPVYDITEDEYQDAIDDALDELDSSSEDLLDEDLNMVVYVDNNSNIIGREFTIDDSDAVLGYTFINKGNKDEYNMYAEDDNGNTILDISGSQTKENGAYDGEATIEISDPDEYYFTDVSIDLDYEDFRTERKNERFYQYGTLNLSSAAFMGIEVTSEYSVENDIQNNKLIFQMGASPLVTIDTTTEYLNDYQVTMLPDDAEVYDISDIEGYEASLNLDDYISKLSEELGVDLQGLIDYYTGGYYY